MPSDDQKQLLRASANGWSSGESPAGTPEKPFLAVMRNDHDADTPAWFIATGKGMPVCVLHAPKGGRHFLIRQFKIEGAGDGLQEIRRYVARVAQPRALVGNAQGAGEASAQPVVLKFDLRDPLPPGTVVSNAYVHKEPFGGEATYWAPRKLGTWARVKYKLSAPFPIEAVVLQGVGVQAWNRNADKEFDPGAKAFLEVSRDGRKWTPIWSTDPQQGIKNNDKWVEVIRGSKEFFVQARLFGTQQANPSVHHVQFLRGEPGRGDIPSLVLFADEESAATFRKERDDKGRLAQAVVVGPDGGGDLGKGPWPINKLRESLVGKTPDQVVRLIGEPKKRGDKEGAPGLLQAIAKSSFDMEIWVYENQSLSGRGKIFSRTEVVFREGTVWKVEGHWEID